MNPTLKVRQTVRMTASRPLGSWRAASAIAALAISEPS
jgi:hypothetical protein